MGSRRFLLLAALVVAAGTALQLPTLDIGFFVDDYVHQLVLAGHAPLVLVQARIIADLSGQLRRAVVSVDPGPADGLPVDALVLQAGNRTLVFSLAATWRIESPRDDVRFSIIQMGSQALAWQRTGPRSCTLRSLGGPMLAHPFETVYLSGREPPQTGDGGSIAVGRVEVLESDASGPIVLGLDFDRELEDTHLRFLVPVPGRALGVVDPPAIGETLMLPAVGPTISMLP